jgi:Zn-finger domain-containing protein
MDQSYRFKLVFTKLQEVLEEDTRKQPLKAKVEIRRTGEVSREDIDEIDKLRRIVLEATEPEPMSFTTT